MLVIRAYVFSILSTLVDYVEEKFNYLLVTELHRALPLDLSQFLQVLSITQLLPTV